MVKILWRFLLWVTIEDSATAVTMISEINATETAATSAAATTAAMESG